ncbi:hypothetical protein EG68_04561 [Paragonimus skrjabini miyazakii]|uniref:Uncharacterized protein n=1 Tax=Paragonimus skrjabini miyazakii TaxID=59628 RepID=A0A8S9YX50_9TREM|nr:hypothetical protein EG68_04561 [Paragonimus skrjabini miyazakii]
MNNASLSRASLEHLRTIIERQKSCSDWSELQDSLDEPDNVMMSESSETHLSQTPSTRNFIPEPNVLLRKVAEGIAPPSYLDNQKFSTRASLPIEEKPLLSTSAEATIHTPKSHRSECDGHTERTRPVRVASNNAIRKSPGTTARKGLYRGSSSVAENTPICNRQRGVSRADLQALVRRQREVRRQERLQQEQIETERRERIQRNLSATAMAASLAAKASTVSTTVPRRRCLSGRTTVTEDQFRTAAHGPIQPLIIMSGHSAEREQKLDELLGHEGAAHWSPKALQDVRKPYNSGPEDSESESTGSLSSRLYVLRDRLALGHKTHDAETRSSAEAASNALSKAIQTAVDVPYSTSDSHRQTFTSNLINETVLGGNMLTMFDGRDCIGSHSDYSVPNLFKSNAPSVPKLDLMTDEHFGSENTDAQELIVLDADVGGMTREAVSTTSSSYGDISPLAGGQWMRLEAVGASEPELAMEDEAHDEFVDDMGTERIDDLFTRAAAMKALSKQPMIPMARTVNDHAANEKVAQNTLKRLIYSDPLRFSALRKRHKTTTRRLRSPTDCAWAQNDQNIVESRAKASSRARGLISTDVDNANRDVCHNTYREASVATHQELSSRGDYITGAPLHINSASDTSSSTSHAPFNRAGQNDFLLDAANQAISSTPRRNQPDRVNLSNVEPPRLTAAALGLRLSAEMNHLEALASSFQHVADMESLRQFAAAQAETVALAQLLKTQRAAEVGGQVQADLSKPRFRSQSTAVTPEPVAEPISQSARSSHFEGVLQAAEEFTRAERRLSEKAAMLEVLHRSCEKRRDSSTSTTSSAVGIPVSRRSASDTFPTDKGHSSGATDPTTGSHQVDQVRRDASQQSRPSLVSALEVHSASKLSTASTSASCGNSETASVSVEAVSTGDDSTMTDRTSIDQDATLSKSIRTGSSVVPKLELGPDTVRVTQQADSSLSSHRSIRPKVASKSPQRRYPREIGRYEATRNMQRGSAEASVETQKHEGRYSVGNNDALTKVNSGLAERAAMLKCRRERAQKLIALSRSLELEEDEVVRLELEALKSAQNKRKSTRSIHDLLSPVTVKSPQSIHSKSHCGQYSSDFTATTRSPARSYHKKSSVGDICPTLSSNGAGGRTELSAVQSVSSASVVNGASKDKQPSNDQSLRTAPVDSVSVISQSKQHLHSDHTSSVAKSLATATSLRTNLASGCSHLTTASRSALTRLGDNLTQSKQKSDIATPHIDLIPADDDKRNLCEVLTPPLRKQLTTDLISSSSDRVTPPVTGHRYPHRRLILSSSARRSRRTSSNFSGPTSVDSLDEDNGVSSDALEPEEQLSVTYSQVDLSEIESRVHALCSGLRQQESLLSRINRLHGQASKDRLTRLQSTLMQHKQLCTEIIRNIRNQLDACQSAVRLNTSAQTTGESNSPSQTTVRTPVSPKLSALFATELAPEQRNTPSIAASMDEETPVNHNVVSLAEDLVSATDTEGDLQKLGFDEKPESPEHSARGITDTQVAALMPTEVDDDESESESRTISVGRNRSPLSSESVKSASSVQCVHESDRRSSSKLNHNQQTPSYFEISDRLTDVDFDNETFSRTPTLAVEKPALLHHLATLSSTSVSAVTASDVDLPAVKQVLHHVVVTDVGIANGELLSTGEVITNYQSTRTDNADDDRHGDKTASCLPTVKTENVEIVRHIASIKQSHPTSVQEPAVRVDGAGPPVVQTEDQMKLTSSSHQTVVDHVTDTLFTKILSDVIDLSVDQMKTRQPVPASVGQSVSDTAVTPPVTKAVFCDDEYLVDNDSSTETKGDSEDETGDEDLEEEMEGEELARDLSPSPSQLFTADNLRGMVADLPSRTQPLIQAVVSHLWRARSEASDGSRESSMQLACGNPPDLFRPDWVDPDYLDPDLHVLPNLRFVSRGLLFDLVAEFIQRVYAGEDEEYIRSRKMANYRPRVSSAQFRIWNGPTRPQTYEKLLNLVETHVAGELGWYQSMSTLTPQSKIPGGSQLPGRANFSRLTQWTLSKKSQVDRLLELELRAEECSWLSYGPEELRLKYDLAKQIWDEQLHEAIESMLNCLRKSAPDKSINQ